MHQSLTRNLDTAQAGTKVLAAYMSWFGDGQHVDVGYSSQDPKVLRRQIEDARNLGISAFVVDWYGDHRPFIDRSFALLQQAASEARFQVALMYDEPADQDDSEAATTDVLDALNKAYQAYIGPTAPYRGSYLTYNGRPVIFIFPKHGHTDWNRVRQRLSEWPTPPLLFYKDEAPAAFTSAFDGYYAWVHPGTSGWTSNGSNWGRQYLEAFYKNMNDRHPDKIPVGAAWPGFDDRRAGWGLNRYIDARCGKTFEDTMRMSHEFYRDSKPLPFLLVETWNDYEEGTAIERLSSAKCINRQS